MTVNEIWNTFWKYSEKRDGSKMLKWIEDNIEKDSKNIDLQYIYLEILRWNNRDSLDYKLEPIVLNYCTELIRDKNISDKLIVAKAYCYRGEMKFSAMDRRKDFDKALQILNVLDQKNPEVNFLKQFIKVQYPLNIRNTLFIDFTSSEMFKF